MQQLSRTIADYAMLGDLRTGLLVDRFGSIDWWTAPRFDSGAVFARLLGDDRAGFWRLHGPAHARAERRYRGHTLVLETTIEDADGSARVSDCLALDTPNPTIVRLVEGLTGALAFTMRLRPRMHYGEVTPWTYQRDGAWHAVVAPDGLVLHSDVPLVAADDEAHAHFVVREQQRVAFTLQWYPAHASAPPPAPARALIEATADAWQQWSDRLAYAGRWRAAVVRSALMLKALTFRETGGMVAALTTSLPERVGGDWNWDYRYCWLRDASFAFTSLRNLGAVDEVRDWCEWLMRVYAGEPDMLHIMYGIAGERLTPESTIPWLAGYRHSVPIRIGNDAHDQFQLGVLGDVVQTIVQAHRSGWPIDPERWSLIRRLIPHLERVWEQPGNGIWEVRGETHRYVHATTMAWLAADGLAQLAAGRNAGDVDRARVLADRIRGDVETRGFDRQRNTFTDYYGSATVDASLLLLLLHEFLPADDPRIVGTIAAIERDLLVDGFLYRFAPQHAREGAFAMCGFWLVQAYVRQGRLGEAVALFERLLATANDVGLLTEEYDVARGEGVGNVPQAFSHSGLIDAALALDAALGGATRRSTREPGMRAG